MATNTLPSAWYSEDPSDVATAVQILHEQNEES